MTTIDVSGEVIGQVREQVWALHGELASSGLVAWTSGNVSARVPGAELMVIKPSGVGYGDLTPAAMVVCDLSGERVEGELLPSSDTAAHGSNYPSSSLSLRPPRQGDAGGGWGSGWAPSARRPSKMMARYRCHRSGGASGR